MKVKLEIDFDNTSDGSAFISDLTDWLEDNFETNDLYEGALMRDNTLVQKLVKPERDWHVSAGLVVSAKTGEQASDKVEALLQLVKGVEFSEIEDCFEND